ncbi:TetR/AcrR family transcriptional regulator, partial [Nostoc sp. NIES-2111]
MHGRRGPFGAHCGPPGAGGRGFGPFRRRGYPQGQLREALREAARSLLAERGAAGFTLGDAAKLAGVSAAAPYRHFRDRDALLSEVAAEGFRRFGFALASALEEEADPEAGLEAMGRAYLAFAHREPGLYAAMFDRVVPTEPGGQNGEDADAAHAGGQAFEALVQGLGAVLAGRGRPELDPRPVALQVWSLAHGVASLARAGHLGPQCGNDPASVLLDGTRAIVGTALRA